MNKEENVMSDISKMVMVFGSNLAGVHGAGAARFAKMMHGAVWGEGVGHHGNSYAIPTKDRKIHTLSTTAIRTFVNDFLKYAAAHPELTFQVTRIGCGLAGYTDREIAPMFMDAPLNCQFDSAWQPILGDRYTYWGHVE